MSGVFASHLVSSPAQNWGMSSRGLYPVKRLEAHSPGKLAGERNQAY